MLSPSHFLPLRPTPAVVLTKCPSVVSQPKDLAPGARRLLGLVASSRTPSRCCRVALGLGQGEVAHGQVQGDLGDDGGLAAQAEGGLAVQVVQHIRRPRHQLLVGVRRVGLMEHGSGRE